MECEITMFGQLLNEMEYNQIVNLQFSQELMLDWRSETIDTGGGISYKFWWSIDKSGDITVVEYDFSNEENYIFKFNRFDPSIQEIINKCEELY